METRSVAKNQLALFFSLVKNTKKRFLNRSPHAKQRETTKKNTHTPPVSLPNTHQKMKATTLHDFPSLAWWKPHIPSFE